MYFLVQANNRQRSGEIGVHRKDMNASYLRKKNDWSWRSSNRTILCKTHIWGNSRLISSTLGTVLMLFWIIFGVKKPHLSGWVQEYHKRKTFSHCHLPKDWRGQNIDTPETTLYNRECLWRALVNEFIQNYLITTMWFPTCISFFFLIPKLLVKSCKYHSWSFNYRGELCKSLEWQPGVKPYMGDCSTVLKAITVLVNGEKKKKKKVVAQS